MAGEILARFVVFFHGTTFYINLRPGHEYGKEKFSGTISISKSGIKTLFINA